MTRRPRLKQPSLYSRQATKITLKVIRAYGPCQVGLDRFWHDDSQQGIRDLSMTLQATRSRAMLPGSDPTAGHGDFYWLLEKLKAPIFKVSILGIASRNNLTEYQVVASSISLDSLWYLIWQRYKVLRSRGKVK